MIFSNGEHLDQSETEKEDAFIVRFHFDKKKWLEMSQENFVDQKPENKVKAEQKIVRQKETNNFFFICDFLFLFIILTSCFVLAKRLKISSAAFNLCLLWFCRGHHASTNHTRVA